MRRWSPCVEKYSPVTAKKRRGGRKKNEDNESLVVPKSRKHRIEDLEEVPAKKGKCKRQNLSSKIHRKSADAGQ